MKKLSVVVPVYYNEGSLPHLFLELSGVEQKLLDKGVELELIFVDDGSGDRSLDELLKIKAHRPATRVIKLTRNFGAVHASKTGLQFVSGDLLTRVVARRQPAKFGAMEAHYRTEPRAPMVLGGRTARDRSSKASSRWEGRGALPRDRWAGPRRRIPTSS